VTRTRSLQSHYGNKDAISPQILKDLYEETEGMDNLTLLCIFANYEPVNSEAVTQDKKQKMNWEKNLKTSIRTEHMNSLLFQRSTSISMSRMCTRKEEFQWRN
jgi:hypothetical protein